MLDQFSAAFAQAAEKLNPSVVPILSEHKVPATRLMFGPGGPQEFFGPEFLRRFCLHLLPERFVKIRHYGLLANRGRKERVARAQALLGVSMGGKQESEQARALDIELAGAQTTSSPRWICPVCGHRALVWVETVGPAARAPPIPHRLAA